MIHATACKVINSCPPAILVDNASLGVTEIDTLGFDYAVIYLILGATDIACSAALLTESDTSASGHATITGTDYGTATNVAGSTSALPTATDDNLIFCWELDLRYRKRYIDGTITVGDGTVGGYYVVFTQLFRAKELPVGATERGVDQILRV